MSIPNYKLCDIRFSLQGRYASVLDLSAFGIKNTCVTIHGSALLAGHGITEGEFIRAKEKEISEALNDYLDHRVLNPHRNDLIILDMEPIYPDPNDPDELINFSPLNLGRYEGDPKMQADLIRAYARRIRVARKVLHKKWPTVKLGLYGVIVPMGKGQQNKEFQKRMKGCKRAGELGMYDLLDYLVPVLYNRFGLSDVPLPNDNFDIAKLHGWTAKATRQGITKTQELTQRNGNTIPLAPILTFWVANGNSEHNGKVILPKTMSLQLRILQKYRAVETIVLWSGKETVEEMESDPDFKFESVDISDFLGRVDGLPFPGCT